MSRMFEAPHHASRPPRDAGRTKRPQLPLGHEATPRGAPYRSRTRPADEAQWNGDLHAQHADEGNPRPPRSAFLSSAKIWFSMAMAALAALALVAFARPVARWTSEEARKLAGALTQQADAPAETAARIETPQSPRLTAASVAPARQGDALPLGVSVNVREGGLIVVAGVPQGASLSAGNRAEDGSWWLSFADLSDLSLRPAPDFVGALNLSIELRRADTSVIDRKLQHLEWIPLGLASAPQSETERTPGALPLAALAPLAPAPSFERRSFETVAPVQAPPAEEAQQAPAAQIAEANPHAKTQAPSASAEDEGSGDQPDAASESDAGRLSGCYIKIDGRVIANGRCHILKPTAKSITFEGRQPVTLSFQRGRMWAMTLNGRQFGKVFKTGSCWGSTRVYICDRNM